MSLEAFAEKINTLAQSEKLGVSQRIALYDEGIELGLKRSAIDKMIDSAVREARELKKQQNQASPSAFEIPDIPTPDLSSVPPPSSLETPTTNIDWEGQKVDTSFSDFEPEIPSIEEIEQETIDVEEIPDLEDYFEPLEEAIQEEQPDLEPQWEPEHSSQTNQKEPSLEDILNEIKGRKQQEESFKNFSQQQEVEYEFGESFDEFKQSGAKPGLHLSYSTFGLVFGIGALIFSGFSILSVPAGFLANYMYNTGMAKINAQSEGFYSKQSKDYLVIGRVLGFIGIGIFFLTRVLN